MFRVGLHGEIVPDNLLFSTRIPCCTYETPIFVLYELIKISRRSVDSQVSLSTGK